MYEQNGNAFDAAVAAGFTLAVVEPSMSGIGGRLQAIYRNSSGKIGEDRCFNSSSYELQKNE